MQMQIGNWKWKAKDSHIMVLHTLVVDPLCARHGYGNAFVEFYEEYAKEKGCIVLCQFNGIPDVQLVCLEKRCN